jgi:hypothetical protein
LEDSLLIDVRPERFELVKSFLEGLSIDEVLFLAGIQTISARAGDRDHKLVVFKEFKAVAE